MSSQVSSPETRPSAAVRGLWPRLGERLPAGLRDALARYHHPMTWTGIGLFGALTLFSFLGPLLYTANPFTIHAMHILSPPSLQYPFGTDNLGRNMLARAMAGGRSTLTVGILGSLVAMLIGIAYGMFAALGPRWLDKALMRLLDALLALPTLVLMIFFAAIIPLDVFSLTLLLGLVSWPGLARIVRNEALAFRERDYVVAARQFGAGTFYIARVHLLRAMLPILIVNTTFMVADVILGLAGLSFLGLGIQPPRASWGGLLNEGVQQVFLNDWWLILFPGLLIFGAILAMNFVGQGLLNRLEGRT